MNKGVIAGISNKFMDVSNDITKDTMDYLKTRTKASYDKLEISLKAMGFSIKTYFDSLADNAPDQIYVDSFRNVSTLAAEIEIIKLSTQLSDIEKLDRLDSVFQKQQEQQREAAKELKQKRKDNLKATLAIGGMTMFGTLILVNKKVGPTIVKIPGQAIKLIGKK